MKRKKIIRPIIMSILLLFSIYLAIKQSKAPVVQWLPAGLQSVFIRESDKTVFGSTLEFLLNVGMAYIASFLFYIMIEYCPRKKREKAVSEMILSHLENIYSNMDYTYCMIVAAMYVVSDHKIKGIPVVMLKRNASLRKYRVEDTESFASYISCNYVEQITERSKIIRDLCSQIFRIVAAINLDIPQIDTVIKVSQDRTVEEFVFCLNVESVSKVVGLDDSLLEYKQLRDMVGALIKKKINHRIALVR